MSEVRGGIPMACGNCKRILIITPLVPTVICNQIDLIILKRENMLNKRRSPKIPSADNENKINKNCASKTCFVLSALLSCRVYTKDN